MSEELKKKLRELLRENGRLRAHNRRLINIYEHYAELQHHTWRRRRKDRARAE